VVLVLGGRASAPPMVGEISQSIVSVAPQSGFAIAHFMRYTLTGRKFYVTPLAYLTSDELLLGMRDLRHSVYRSPEVAMLVFPTSCPLAYALEKSRVTLSRE
jgi:hypothetical protein